MIERMTRKTAARSVPERFVRQYLDPDSKEWTILADGRDCGEVYTQLLGAKTPDEIDEIMGNPSWTHPWCSECRGYVQSAIYLGEGYDTFVICDDCLQRAVGLVQQTPPAP